MMNDMRPGVGGERPGRLQPKPTGSCTLEWGHAPMGAEIRLG
jgi:hypothetical protein